MVNKKENKFIRYKWLENGNPEDQNSFFEFRIETDEITGGLSLFVTEQLDPDTNQDEANDITSLWEHQVSELRRILGV